MAGCLLKIRGKLQRECNPASTGRKPLSKEVTRVLQQAQQIRYGVGARHFREHAQKAVLQPGPSLRLKGK